MSTELEQLLRGGMERFTEDARVPDGLALKAYRHRQKRRMTTRVVTAAGTATVLTAGALAAAGVTGALGSASGQPALTTTQIKTDAYVFGRVEHALAAQAQDNVLEYDRTVFGPGVAIEPVGPATLKISKAGASSPWSVGYSLRWMYQGTLKMSAFTASGQRVFDLGITQEGPAPGSVMAIYGSSTYWRASLPAAGNGGSGPITCGPNIELGSGFGNGWPAFIRSELKCGEYVVTGRQVVDGIDAIKITGGGDRHITLWVSPSTYLPVRLVDGPGTGRQTDFSWLAPTPANLAALNVTVPPGFRQVPPPAQADVP
jgi:hypothetical protein